MKRRWLWITVCALLGLVMLLGGLMVPVHLRALDVRVIRTAGEGSVSLCEQGLQLASENQLGAAELMLLAAQGLNLPDAQALRKVISSQAGQHADLRIWGAPRTTDLESLDLSIPTNRSEETTQPTGNSTPSSLPITEILVYGENRKQVLESLTVSRMPGVQNLMTCRSLTNTTLFSPSQSASGQALDIAISLCGLLLQERQLTASLGDALSKAALKANYGKDPGPLEHMLLDMMSLGQRMSWGQLIAFVAPVNDAETLRLLTDQVRNAGGQMPTLYSAVLLSGNPSGVTGYLGKFSQTGLKDLRTSLEFGKGGVTELLQGQKRLVDSGSRRYLPDSAALNSLTHSASTLVWKLPVLALAIKWLMYCLSGFCIAAAMHFARRPVSTLEQPLQVRGFHLARESLFALGFLFVVLLLSEPFLAEEGQKEAPRFQLHLPALGGVIHAQQPITSRSFMNQVNLLTLLLFFVLQALIYTACVIKLAEIRRQKVPARMKLKLLENEDHLFDAGLYLGFVGTIISLILVSMGIASFSLMAAYSSTSFGIIFVSLFKIFNLRSARRKLLLEADSALGRPIRPTVTPALSTQS